MYTVGSDRRGSTNLTAGLTLEVTASAFGPVKVYNRGQILTADQLSDPVEIAAGETAQFGPYADPTNFVFINSPGGDATYEMKKLERVAAADVRVADNAENFTGRSVEDALAEIATRLDALEA